MRPRLLLVSLLILFALWCTTATSAQSIPQWQPNTFYAVGALVMYNGVEYQCLQAHTSEVGWEPPNTPALWQPVTGGGGGSCSSVPSAPTGLAGHPQAVREPALAGRQFHLLPTAALRITPSTRTATRSGQPPAQALPSPASHPRQLIPSRLRPATPPECRDRVRACRLQPPPAAEVAEGEADALRHGVRRRSIPGA